MNEDRYRFGTVTAVNTSTGICTVDVGPASSSMLVSALALTSDFPKVGWVVWVEHRGGLRADWVVVDVQTPTIRQFVGTFSGGTTDVNGRLANIAHGAPFTPSKLACFPTVDGGGPQWESCVPTAITSTTFTGRFWSGGAFKVSQTVSGGWLLAYL